jgi:hypothetical protein
MFQVLEGRLPYEVDNMYQLIQKTKEQKYSFTPTYDLRILIIQQIIHDLMSLVCNIRP